MESRQAVNDLGCEIMRILIVSDLYPPVVDGGYEIRCQETADELTRRGHQITVLTSRLPGSGPHNKQGTTGVFRVLFRNSLNDYGVIRQDFLRVRRRYHQLQWMVCNRMNYRLTFRLANALRPDFVFFWNMEGVGVEPILAVQNLGLPRVYSIGDYWIVRLKDELTSHAGLVIHVFRTLMTGLKDFRQLDLRPLIVNSQALKQIYAEHGFSPKDIYVIPRGIQSEQVMEIDAASMRSGREQAVFKLLFVGRLVPEKGPDVAITVVKILRDRYGMDNLALDIYGHGPADYGSKLSSIILKNHLEKQIAFKGWLARDDLIQLYEKYDALLLPSRWEEPFSGTLLEAMARGVPVVASARGGTLEVIQNEVNGLLVPPDDAGAAADAVYRILREDGLAERLRAEGVNTIRNRFTLENVVDQYLKLARAALRSTDS